MKAHSIEFPVPDIRSVTASWLSHIYVYLHKHVIVILIHILCYKLSGKSVEKLVMKLTVIITAR